MVDRDNGQDFDKEKFDQRQQRGVFDDDVVEDVDSIQEPYPANDIAENENDENQNSEVEDPDKVREYEDNDHPHEYRSPKAVLDDYSGVSGRDNSNAFERQNPLQSTLPSSDRDR